MGPYRNPNEKYPFLSKVPFCKPENSQNSDKLKKIAADAGSVFMGDRATLSDYILPFDSNIHEPKVVCKKTLDQNDIKKYIDIIKENYMFEFFVDNNLLVTGFLGKEEGEIEDDTNNNDVDTNQDIKHYYLFTHWNFHCEYNGHYVCKYV